MQPQAPREVTPPTPSALTRVCRWFLAGLAVLCIAIGGIGIVVPGLPTTVFWLLAVLLAGKSCPAVQRWVYRRGSLGATVQDIVVSRCMRRSAKRHALVGMWVMLGVSAGLMLSLGRPGSGWLVACLPVIGAGVTGFIVFGLRDLPRGRTGPTPFGDLTRTAVLPTLPSFTQARSGPELCRNRDAVATAEHQQGPARATDG